MITVHAGTCYKALIDSGATVSFLQYSTDQNIQESFKTPIQPTTAKLKTADGSPITALSMTALHLWIAEFKFTHTFVICSRLPDMEIIFSIDIQKKFSLSYTWDKEKNSVLGFSFCLKLYYLLQNKYYFFSNDKLLLPTGQLHQVLWIMFSPLVLSLKILFFIILF